MRAARPARAQQSLPNDSVPDCSVSYAPLLSTRFLAGTGRLVMVRGLLTEGLPFLGKVLQCACQGDAKRCVPHTYFLPGPGTLRAAKPCVRQSRHPAKFF